MEEDEVKRLKERISQLKKELESLKTSRGTREKIEQMSSEVVDSNPYRYWYRP